MFFDFQQQQDDLIKSALKDPKKNDKVQKKLLKDFQDFGHQTKLIILFVYCNRPENVERGRVGQVAGWRLGSICFRMIPDNKRPQSRKPEDGAVRYYDYFRANWRSFRRSCFVKIGFFWDEKNNDFVEDPRECGLKRNAKNTNSEYPYKARRDTSEERKKRRDVEYKEAEKRAREIEKTQKKLNKGEHIIFDIFNMDIQELKKQNIGKNIF